MPNPPLVAPATQRSRPGAFREERGGADGTSDPDSDGCRPKLFASYSLSLRPVDQPVEAVDARTDRVAQGALGIALLAGFVFRVPWLVPGVAVILAVAALGGPRANALHQVFERLIAPRLPSPGAIAAEPRVAGTTVRAQDALATAILLVATIAFVLGISFVGWILVLAEAIIAIMAATTRVHVADRLRRSR